MTQLFIACKKHQHPRLKKYTTFSKNRDCEDHASRGVFIAVSEQFDAFEIQLITELEAIAVTVQLPRKIHLCNIHLSNSQTLNLVKLETLVSQLPTPFILLGDFNSHHYLWGMKQIVVGKILKNYQKTQKLPYSIQVDLTLCSSILTLRMGTPTRSP